MKMTKAQRLAGTLLLLPFAAYGITLNWVFINVWNGYGYWVWYSGGSSSGSW